MPTQNHIFSEVSATKVQVLYKKQTLCNVVQVGQILIFYSLPISIPLKETQLGEEQTTSNGVTAGGNNGDLGGGSETLGGNGVLLLGGGSEVVGGGNGVLGGGKAALGGGNGVLGDNGVLRSNTGFVSI